MRTYTITNNGTADLTLGSVAVGGAQAADFTVNLQPSAPIAASGSTSFQVTFDPSATGTRSATLSLSNNDADENPFDFSIQGTGTAVPDAPQIISATPLNQAARISFNAPGSNGGSAIVDYTASCTPGLVSNTQNALVIEIAGLSNNVAYRCSVRARNALGLSAPSAELSVISGASGTSADLSISKTNRSSYIYGDGFVDYSIVVSNPGATAVVGARVQDPIALGFQGAAWICTGLNNAYCPSSGSGALDIQVDLPAASSVQIIFSALPVAGAETPLSNTASVSVPVGISDPLSSNNSATDGPDVRGIFRGGFE